MSPFLFAVPDELAAASSSLTSLRSSIREARVAAAGSTTSIIAAAEDEVSAAVARLFGGYAQQFQALGAQASLFHDQLVQALKGGGFLYGPLRPPARRRCKRPRLQPRACKTRSIRRSSSSRGGRCFGRAPMGRRAPGRPVVPVGGCGANAGGAITTSTGTGGDGGSGTGAGNTSGDGGAADLTVPPPALVTGAVVIGAPGANVP